MDELWSVIDDYPNYSVSSLGRIRNNTTGRFIKPRPAWNGYMRVCLYDGHGRPQEALVHRLVARAFCEGFTDELDVNHIDGSKHNNDMGNLEWCTRSDNLKHAYKTGLAKSPRNRCRPVRIVETGEVFESVRDCARFLGCMHSNISLCLNGYQNTCYGYHFEFVEQ